MSRIAFLQDLLSSVFQRQPAEPVREDDRRFEELCADLLAERAEMSGNRLAQSIFARFDQADATEREAFFCWLAEDMDVDGAAALDAARAFAEDRRIDNLEALMRHTEPRRQELFRRLNRLPGATARLVAMRQCLLALQRTRPELARVDLDFSHLLSSWFNRGFLVLREIDWHSPANVLEKIIAYEAVHAINSWAELRRRLEPEDRKCFAFFHPAMLDEPLIFVEVALTRTLPESISAILEPAEPPLNATEATTAVFYSISNCQPGLAGVSFGNSLIKQVASELAVQLPGLSTFRTLSPVPGFITWLQQTRVDESFKASAASALDIAGHRAAPTADRELADADAGAPGAGTLRPGMTGGRRAGDTPPTSEPPAHSAATGRRSSDTGERLAMQKLLAHYLVDQRRNDQQPLDPVARFHLGNGAMLDAILPGADRSANALGQSAGAMVSYLYDSARVDTNQEAYARQRRVELTAALAQQLGRPPRTQGQTRRDDDAQPAV